MTITLNKTYNFVRRNLRCNKMFLVTCVTGYLRRDFPVSRQFLSREGVARALAAGKSLVRIGDGEIGLLNGKGIGFQAFDERIQESLSRAINDYRPDSPYLIALPQRYLLRSNRQLRALGMLRLWLPLKAMVAARFPREPEYADAHLFYYREGFDQTVRPAVSGRPGIFLVNGPTAAALAATSLPWLAGLKVVVTREEHAFADIDRLRHDLAEAVSELAPVGDPVVFCSCGPAGKVLVLECAAKGIQAIDLGAGIEVLLTGVGIEARI